MANDAASTGSIVDEISSSLRQEVSLDYIHYCIHIVDGSMTDTERQKVLKRIEVNSVQLTEALLSEYIWHCEALSLTSGKLKGKSYLRGRTRVAESLEDEWLIVYILLESTKSFNSAWTKVNDSDGEFLLVEAAGVLPSWLKPQVAENRIWINQGKLFIIPNTKSCISGGPGIDGPISKSIALEFLEVNPNALLRLKRLEAEAFRRVRHYPAQIPKNLHRATVVTSRKLAHILHENPNYISPALESLFTWSGDKIDPLSRLSVQNTTFKPDDLVTIVVKFTKVAYARLQSDVHRLPHSWKSNFAQHDIALTNGTAFDLGLKLAFAFETLVSDSKKKDHRIVREIKLELDDLEKNEASLPSDVEIGMWEAAVDDETWLEVNFESFDAKLSQRNAAHTKSGPEALDDREALSGMLSHADHVLKDYDQGQDGSLFDDSDDPENSDYSDYSDNAGGGSSEEAITPRSKDLGRGDDFTLLMREIMGMSQETMAELMGRNATTGLSKP